MKTTLKFSTLLVALASVFTFSSCLNSNNDSTYPAYASYVTITGDQFLGYTFHSDFGCTLRPTSASVQEVLPGLGNSKVKRAYVAFDLASETENGKNLEVGKIYDIILRQSYYANYAIPTYNTIKLTAASDSLITKNKSVQSIDEKNIWASNGYINALITINYQQNKTFSMNTYYSEEDIDVANNTLNLNLYYNSNSESQNAQGQSVFSFRLPEEVIYSNHFSTDSITLVLNAISGYDNSQLNKVGECKVAMKDFSEPMF
jgi:hypothetical protein